MRLFYIFMFMLIGAPLMVVFAQESATNSPTTTTDTVTEPITVERAPEIRRAALSAVAQVRLTNLAANLSNRLDASVRRITNVTTRLESRATKMNAAGIDVSVAQTKIDDAKRHLDTARGALANIDVEVATFVGSQNPRERWQTLRNTYTIARSSIMDAHKATVEAVLLLQTATPGPTATTTESGVSGVQ